MTPTKPEPTKNPKSPEPKNDVAAAPAAVPAPEESTKTDATKPEKSSKGRDGRRVLSVSIPEKLARQVRLLCNVTGTSAQELVESALRRAVNKQLAGALEAIKSDVEG
jgi:hypothetical protein